MPRSPRIDFPGARHHVMNRGARRADVFLDAETYARFLSFVAEIGPRFGTRVHGFALMPNHYHLLVTSDTGALSRAIQYLDGRIAQWLNYRRGWDGPIWRGRFKNRLVQDEAYWRYLFAYVHLNPVRAGLTRHVTDEAWTSHRYYSGHLGCPDWLASAEVIEDFGGYMAMLTYIESVDRGLMSAPEGFDDLWGREVSQVVPAFRRASVRQALEEVALVTGHLCPERSGDRRVRDLAVWWLSRRACLEGARIAPMLGVSEATVSRALERVRSQEPPKLAALVELAAHRRVA